MTRWSFQLLTMVCPINKNRITQTCLLYCAICLWFISNTHGNSKVLDEAVGKEWNLENFQEKWTRIERIKRDDNSQIFTAESAIPENVGYDEDLFDLASTNIAGNFRAVNNSAGIPDLFVIENERILRLNSSISSSERKTFDYESYPMFEVFLLATESGSTNVVSLTIRLPLSDVNDEPPQFVMEASPFLAQVASDAIPWTIVYRLKARDEDSNPDLQMKLVAVQPEEYFSRFSLQEETHLSSELKGSIVVSGTGVLPPQQELALIVTVEDRNAAGHPQITIGSVYVLVGVRPPQFYSPIYSGYIYESVEDDDRNSVMTYDDAPLVVKVLNFDPYSTFDVKVMELDGSESTRFEMTDKGQIVNRQVIDFETTKRVELTLEAKTAGSDRKNTSKLLLSIYDKNDNEPIFTKDNYMTSVREDILIADQIIEVTATDLDSELNGELEFFLLNNDKFSIETTKEGKVFHGKIKVNASLDYDSLAVPVLTFPVLVADKGVPAKTATAYAIVTLENVNDNEPEITIDGSVNGTIGMVETMEIGSVVTVVLAWDRDWDGVTFSFADGRLRHDIFSIAPTTGVIRTTGLVDRNRDNYQLTILAADDGTCCKGETTRTSTSALTVNIIDINSNKPEFLSCNSYDMASSVLERSESGTSVITVTATDTDRGENGRILYEIDETNSPFGIDTDKGIVTVKEQFSRKANGYEQVTVVGRNPGEVPLMMGWCSFRVRVDALNNHPPKFSTSRYNAEVLRSARSGEVIVEMLATDADIGENAKITYQLSPRYDVSGGQIFSIDGQTGAVSLLTRVNQDVDYVYEHKITATDNGTHPGALSGTTTLNIKVVSQKTNTPSWINPPTNKEFYVAENVGSGHVITGLTCRSSYSIDPRVSFIVYNAEDSITIESREFKVVETSSNTNNVNLVTTGTNLDYEERKQYVIHVVCQDFDTTNDDTELTLTIKLRDVNDERPRFVGLVGINDGYYIGSVPENSNPGSFVTYVQAVDDDTVEAFKNITFSIDGEESNLFSVDRVSDNQARILTRKQLDRETKDEYNVKVIAMDGAPSALEKDSLKHNTASRQILVKVTDVNDNPPFFEKALYSHTVSENANVNDLVFSVTAKDVDLVDKELDYVFTSGNTNGVFSVFSGSGEIRVARKLDYDTMTDKVYRLTLQATDQGAVHTNTTTVEITVLDENDNPPVFTQVTYDVKDRVLEHDTSVTKDNPLFLAQVAATDKDKRQETDIRYSLLNAGISTQRLFEIETISGNISLTGALDGNGVEPFYALAVKAEDERIDPLIGYAEVKVYPTVVNNRPVFEREDIQVYLDENPPQDTLVATIKATDKDEGLNGTVRYQLAPEQLSQDDSQYFRIELVSGDLKTKGDPHALDRERLARVHVTVQAYDQGTPSLSATATVTVVLRDLNDNAPKFQHNKYNLSISENEIGKIARYPIRAEDKDVDLQNRQLVYSILGDQSGHFFVMSSSNDLETAFIGVNSTNPLDYEKGPHTLTFDLHVTDGDVNHVDTAAITVFVTDYNDNAPVFIADSVSVTLLEGTPRLSRVTQFQATDADEGINAKIVFSILRESDPRHEFFIHPDNGTVITRKLLDREKEPVITVIIVATDSGIIPLSSSATLVVTLTDKNDWAPEFREPYLPKLEENIAFDNKLVVEIFAIDRDTLPLGPPFGFKLPPSYTSQKSPKFQLEMRKDGDGGNGTALIRTSATFDREEQKEYHLPIVMWDMADKNDQSLTATNTLTIIIGDVNDNEHFPGHKDIQVNSYRGTQGPKEIGRVFANDLDDWDLPDKTFTADLSSVMELYFRVARDTGMITMYENVPPNKLQSFDTYDFNVDVYDKKFDKTVKCTVSIRVDELADEAVWKSGSMRLTGVTAEGFITKAGTSESKYDLFRDKLSSILGYANASHVDVVSIQESDDGLDIRFSGHGSPYLNPAQVESAVMLNKDEFESSLGVKIKMLPINFCMEEMYDVGCSMVLDVTDEANLVNANGTSFVGVKVIPKVVPYCMDCVFPTPQRCNGAYCYNGGTCNQDDWGKITCQCSPGFDGPRCQQRRHHFNGLSVAFYDSLSVSAEGRTMFDLITLDGDGLIMSTSVSKGQNDYFIFELKAGYPRLRINLGAGELDLTLDGKNKHGDEKMKMLNDGKWHHVDIDRKGPYVQLTIDKCQIADVTPPEGIIHDWTPCRVSGTVPGPDILLNTPGFLHVGGAYPHDPDLGLPSKGFSGCLKNLIHNTKLYDLSYKEIPDWNSGNANCPREEKTCDGGSVCGQRADCVTEWLPAPDRVTKCTCHPGWKGDKCEEKTPIKDLGTTSFYKWELNQQLTNDSVRSHKVSLMFRTRQDNGTLFSMTNDQLESIVIRLSGGKLVVLHNMGGTSEKTVVLTNANAASGQWHTLQAERYGNEFSLSLDNGEGRNYNYDIGLDDVTVEFRSLPFVSSGARIDHVIQNRVGDEDHSDEDLVSSCISDVRYNDVWLPMDDGTQLPDGNGWAAKLVESNNVKDGCSRQDCVPNNCAPGTICHPLWEDHVCKPEVINCGSHVCQNGGECLTVNNVTSCVCVYPWVGVNCNLSGVAGVIEEDEYSFLAAGSIAGIVVGIMLLLILIVLIILFIAYWRQRGEKDHLVAELEDDHARENIMYYDEEGAGEKDSDGYNLTHLQHVPEPRFRLTYNKPVFSEYADIDVTRSAAPRSGIGRLIMDKMDDIDKTDHLNEDETLAYADEGSCSIAGSLSTISSASGSDASQEYDYLGGWGPKFSRLAEMYGAGADSTS